MHGRRDLRGPGVDPNFCVAGARPKRETGTRKGDTPVLSLPLTPLSKPERNRAPMPRSAANDNTTNTNTTTYTSANANGTSSHSSPLQVRSLRACTGCLAGMSVPRRILVVASSGDQLTILIDPQLTASIIDLSISFTTALHIPPILQNGSKGKRPTERSAPQPALVSSVHIPTAPPGGPFGNARNVVLNNSTFIDVGHSP